MDTYCLYIGVFKIANQHFYEKDLGMCINICVCVACVHVMSRVHLRSPLSWFTSLTCTWGPPVGWAGGRRTPETDLSLPRQRYICKRVLLHLTFDGDSGKLPLGPYASEATDLPVAYFSGRLSDLGGGDLIDD